MKKMSDSVRYLHSKPTRSKTHQNCQEMTQRQLSLQPDRSSPGSPSSNRVSKYLDDLKKSNKSGAPTLSINDPVNRGGPGESSSDEATSALNELLHESESDGDAFDPSRLDGRGKRRKGRQVRRQEVDGDDNEAIMAMLKRIQEALLDKGRSQGHRSHRGRQPRTNREVQMVKKVENDDLRLQVLVCVFECLLMAPHDSQQGICRNIFKDAFDVQRDDDFLNYDSLDSDGMSTTEIDMENLRLDMNKGANNEWNEAVLHILVKRVEKAHQHARLPERSREYFEDLVRDKFERARTYWRKGRRRITADCVLETPDEVAARIESTKDRELAGARDRERKAAVCAHSSSQEQRLIIELYRNSAAAWTL
jgi:hypothetical protein